MEFCDSADVCLDSFQSGKTREDRDHSGMSDILSESGAEEIVL